MSTVSKRNRRSAIANPPKLRDTRFSIFDRQEKIDGWIQSALSKATILLIGLGGIGVRFALTLVRMGVRRIVLIDHDRVEDNNLHRTPLYFHSDVGTFKAFAALENLLPHCTYPTEIIAYNLKFDELLIIGETFADASCFVCGVDNDDARELASRHFCKLGVPGVFAAVDLQASSAALIVQEPGKACWRCFQDVDHVNQTAPCGSASSPEVLDFVCGAGVFGVTSLLMNRPRNWNYRIFSLQAFMPDQALTIERRRCCPGCS
jgi:molybdopterin/thiamine biosynthesis adenylyltransferase